MQGGRISTSPYCWPKKEDTVDLKPTELPDCKVHLLANLRRQIELLSAALSRGHLESAVKLHRLKSEEAELTGTEYKAPQDCSDCHGRGYYWRRGRRVTCTHV